MEVARFGCMGLKISYALSVGLFFRILELQNGTMIRGFTGLFYSGYSKENNEKYWKCVFF